MEKPTYRLTPQGLRKFVDALEKKGANYFKGNPKSAENINYSALEKAAKPETGISRETFEYIFQKNVGRGSNEGSLNKVANWLGVKLDLLHDCRAIEPPPKAKTTHSPPETLIPVPQPPQNVHEAEQNKIFIAETCPYVGLNAFDDKTAQWFFGREKAFKQLLDKIKQSPFVFVVGVSGIGKSSLVKAKLIPEMEQRGYQILLMKPWSNPIQRLKDALTEDTGADVGELEEQIDREGLLAAIADLPTKRNLLVIDQFEEVFTVCSREDERSKFIQMLVDVAQQDNSDFMIVATMRIDFLPECSRANLNKIVNEQMVVISDMSENELRDAIAKPAETQGYQLSDGLLDSILQDIEAEPNCLPLLEFALQELWQTRDRQKRLLTLDGYREMNRLKGALNCHAEKLYAEQSQNGQEWMRRIFLKLVRTGKDTKDTRRREQRQELWGLVGSDANAKKEIERVLQRLEGEKGRLLAASVENEVAIVDLAHEALMDGWKRFADWRSQDRDLRRKADMVRDAFNQWNETKDIEKFSMSLGFFEEIEKVETEINDYLTTERQFLQQNRFKYKPWLNPDNFPKLVDIPSGKFWMGSPEGKGNSSEKPYHLVTVPAFRMGKYPVTQAQWRTVAMSPKIDLDLRLSPSYFRDDNRPVEQVTWHEAQEFCARLSNLTGESYRLPCEAEWEYACRAGADDYIEYWFGNDVSQLSNYAWFGNNSGEIALDALTIRQEVGKDSNQYSKKLKENGNSTHILGGNDPNAWGLYDLHGNVWEWCEDDWHGNYDDAPIDGSAWIVPDRTVSDYRLLRGGSWDNYSNYCRLAFRHKTYAVNRSYSVGFRVVVSVFGSS
jgi:formylglycine-generating enzyme required for sulfatase activity